MKNLPGATRGRREGRNIAAGAVAAVLLVLASACAPARRAPEPETRAVPPERTPVHDTRPAPPDRPPEPEAEPTPAPGQEEGVPSHEGDDDPGSAFHVVEPGQTVWRIARTYGVELDEIVRANGMADPSRIAVGDVLQIPGAREPLEVAPYPAPIPPRGKRGRVRPVFESPEIALSWPLDGARVVSRYGVPRGHRRHAGIDFDGDQGDPVRAAADGIVLYAGATMRGYGKTIIVDHGEGITTLYAHNHRLLVRRGESVARGEVIARVGSTGNATGSHCHFELRIHDVPVDPTTKFGSSVAARTP